MSDTSDSTDLDPVALEILRNQLESVAEEMGEVLIRGAYSPNITERRDCSTALFDADGRMIAQAEHIPVHLGAMPEAVAAVRDRSPRPGDVFVLNDPFAGGTHLPDVTMVSPIPYDGRIEGYAVSRAHHADVGGMAPGSMPAGATDLYQEGLRIPPVRYVDASDVPGDRGGNDHGDGGSVSGTVEGLLLANVRNPRERRADLRAQLAANQRGHERVGDLLDDHGNRLRDAFEAVIDYSRERVEHELRDLPDGTYHASDVMEGDGVRGVSPGRGTNDADDADHTGDAVDTDIPIEVTVTIDGATVEVDFAGTAEQAPGNVNAPPSVTRSAVYFVIRCITDPEIPPNHGCYEPVTIEIPDGSLLDPEPPAAVVGGNVETSQRVTDVVFAALADAAPDRVPAQGQGTMNNLVIGGPAFAYYETIGGGAGGNPDSDGLSGVQVGMTNTLNTPIEALEREYPIRVERYAIRDGSGGAGGYRGGDGLVRSVTVETAATVSILSERRRHAPRGLAGGQDGQPGENRIDGTVVGPKITRDVTAGTTVTIETPGGGGHGEPSGERDPADDSRGDPSGDSGGDPSGDSGGDPGGDSGGDDSDESE